VTFGLPLIREHILRVVAARTRTHVVLVVAAEFADRFHLMELVCSVRVVGLFPWLVIAALDDPLYKFAVTRGLPVYLSECEQGDFGRSHSCKEIVRYQVILDSLRSGRTVYSVAVESVFVSSPWNRFAREIDEATDVAIPVHRKNALGHSSMPPALVYAKPSDKSLALFEKVIKELKRVNEASSSIMAELTCNAKTSTLTGSGKCMLKNGVVLQVLDEHNVRALEDHDRPHSFNRKKPILYFAAVRREASRYVQMLGARGLSRHDRSTGLCIYGR